ATQVGAAIEEQSAATRAIADAVDGASRATRHTAESLDGVSNASDRCNEAAGGMHKISFEVADQVGALQRSLAELLHTRIAELDPRSSARSRVRMPARLEHANSVADCVVLDISAGGVRLDRLAEGITGGRLVVAGLPPVQAAVTGISDAGA